MNIAMIQMTITDTEILAIEDGKSLGKIEFTLSDNNITILHTYAYESGRGIGTLLMKNAVELAKENQYTIIPICSFALKYLSEKNEFTPQRSALIRGGRN
jgi:predicted GNAT family acetyltransferase